MKKCLQAATLLAMLCGSASANAAPVMWTLSDIAFDRDGFQTYYLTGNFTYDAGTNTFSNVNLTQYLSQACCWNAGITTATSTANSLNFFTAGAGCLTAHLDLASLLTDAGGTIALTSGNMGGTVHFGTDHRACS